MPKAEPEPGEMIPEEPTTGGKKGKRKKKKKGLKSVSSYLNVVDNLTNELKLILKSEFI